MRNEPFLKIALIDLPGPKIWEKRMKRKNEEEEEDRRGTGPSV
jgi:hypothetical protein